MNARNFGIGVGNSTFQKISSMSIAAQAHIQPPKACSPSSPPTKSIGGYPFVSSLSNAASFAASFYKRSGIGIRGGSGKSGRGSSSSANSATARSRKTTKTGKGSSKKMSTKGKAKYVFP